MKILLSFLQASRSYDIPPYQFWMHYITRGLEEAGHEWLSVPDVDWVEGLVVREGPDHESWKERSWSRTVDFARREGADLFLSYLFPWQVDASAIKQIRALGIPTVNFYCDNVRDFRRIPKSYAPFDLHWVPEVKALPMYRDAGYRAVHAAMPCWVEPAHRTHEHEERFGAVFIGSRDGPRERLFAEVLGRGEDLEIYGGGWRAGNNRAVPAQDSHSSVGALTKIKRQIEFVNKEGIPAWVRKMGPKPASVDDAVFAQVARGSLAPDKYAATIQGARTLIGVNRYESYRYPVARPDSYSRLRDIEAPMMGACYLTEWCPDLDHMYEPGRHLEVYRTSDEMIGKLGELNADVEKRRRLRQEGQKWALAKHSVGKSLQRIGDALSGGTSVA